MTFKNKSNRVVTIPSDSEDHTSIHNISEKTFLSPLSPPDGYHACSDNPSIYPKSDDYHSIPDSDPIPPPIHRKTTTIQHETVKTTTIKTRGKVTTHTTRRVKLVTHFR